MSYLEEFLEKISFLPNDINRQLRLIRELDEKCAGKFSELENKQAIYLGSLKGSKERKTELRKRENSQLYEEILTLQEECHGISMEKVEIANQVHEQLDDYIQKLDKDIKRFEHEIKETTINEVKEPTNDYFKSDISMNQRKKKKYESKMSKYKSKKKMVEKQVYFPEPQPEINPFGELDYIQDAPESKYCYCNKDLMGSEMILCDNPYCEREWFHFQCVGLKKKPKENEKWYCRECSQLKKDNLLKF